MKKLNAFAFGIASAVTTSFGMLILGIAGAMGVYTNAAMAMRQWHMFFSLSPAGIIGGIIEAAIFSFLVGYLFAWVYNKFTTYHEK